MQQRLPEWINQFIDERLHGLSLKALAQAYRAMAQSYGARVAGSDASRARPQAPDARDFWPAYLAARFPATHAALCQVAQVLPNERLAEIRTLMDIGAGPATAWLALSPYLPNLDRSLLIERDAQAIELGEAILQASPTSPQALTWRNAEARQTLTAAPVSDLVCMAYSLGEMDEAEQERVLDLAWEKCGSLFLIIEPGTPRAFDALRKARARLLAQGALLAAPCPHEVACPMPLDSQERWCHFSARLERRKAARFIKGGEQGWEDERFTYLALTRKAWPRPKGRVIGAPRLIEGEAHADLCLPEGLVHLSAPKHRKARFKALRKAHWGGPWQGAILPGEHKPA